MIDFLDQLERDLVEAIDRRERAPAPRRPFPRVRLDVAAAAVALALAIALVVVIGSQHESEKAVKKALLLEAIAEREGINPADDEVDTEIERVAQAAQRPALAVRRMMEKSGDLENLRGGLREKKTLDFLIQHAKVSA